MFTSFTNNAYLSWNGDDENITMSMMIMIKDQISRDFTIYHPCKKNIVSQKGIKMQDLVELDKTFGQH